MSKNYDDKKLIKTIEIFDEYERLFANARASYVRRDMCDEKVRKEVYDTVCDVIKFDEGLIPEIKIVSEKEQVISDIKVRHLMAETWENFYAVASLFIPEGEGKKPLIIVCPGHGKYGRLTKTYKNIALTLAKMGSYVLLLDNIGQGARCEFGHGDVPEAFYCGRTVMGFIVAETCAWIRYMKNMDFVDITKIGACGNSGGGTITQFLCAVEPSLSAVASCGYPCEYAYILQKEKKHCDCNILFHPISRLEMWETYSLFAPKPLLINAGKFDHLIPMEYFLRNARKIEAVYNKMEKSENFEALLTSTTHPWEDEDLIGITAFFEKHFGLNKIDKLYEFEITHEEVGLKFPKDAISTGKMIENVTGIKMPEGTRLEDIVKPKYKGEEIKRDDVVSDLGRGDMMRIFSQLEISL